MKAISLSLVFNWFSQMIVLVVGAASLQSVGVLLLVTMSPRKQQSVEIYLLFPGKVFWLSIQFSFLLIEMTYLKGLVSFKSLWYCQKRLSDVGNSK